MAPKSARLKDPLYFRKGQGTWPGLRQLVSARALQPGSSKIRRPSTAGACGVLDPNTPKEVFYDAGFKSGSQLEFQVQDFCILFSLLLQHGMTPGEVAKSLARKEQPDGALKYASISGMIVAELTKPPQWGADL